MRFDKVFITGGAGFIGSRLSRKLAANGAHITVYDSFHPQVHHDGLDPFEDLPQITVVRGDVADKARLEDAVKRAQPNLIYHLAAETGTGQSYDEPSRYCEANVLGTTNLVESIRKIPTPNMRVILAGSRAVYGEGGFADKSGQTAVGKSRSIDEMSAGNFEVLDENGEALSPIPTPEHLAPAPASVYASTKLMQEYILEQCAAEGDFELGLLRFQNVYGPGQSLKNPYTGVLSIFCSQILNDQVLNIYEDGDIVRDFVFVGDVVNALASCSETETLPKGPINIGSGQAATILETAQILLKKLDRDVSQYKISGQFRPGDVRHAVADITKAKSELGWLPEVSLEEGLEALASWAKEALAEHT